MKHLKHFEVNFGDSIEVHTILKNISQEFWEMTKIANWNKAIKIYNENDWDTYMNRRDEPAGRIYKKYEFNQIVGFQREYDKLYDRLYTYFKSYWLFKPGYNISDDGFSDLLSSIIGKGLKWTIKCIRDPLLPKKMAKEHDYLENFGYILQVDREVYDEIRSKYDPIYKQTNKFNL